MTIIVNSDFAKWAVGFSGCDGGNFGGATIWFSGIEWGLGFDPKTFDFSKDCLSNLGWDDDYRKKFQSNPFDRGVVQMYSGLIGAGVDKHIEVAQNKKVFSQESKLFKMNIYPIAFKRDGDELWNEDWYQKTGMPTKSMYRAWCQEYRFPKFKGWVEEHRPKLIVAAGSSYKSDYILAFAGAEGLYKHSKKDPEKIEDRELFWCNLNNGRTILAITPFFGGRWGLNSYNLIEKFSSRIKEICEEKFNDKEWYESK